MKITIPESLKNIVNPYTNRYRKYMVDYFGYDNSENEMKYLEDKLGVFKKKKEIKTPLTCVFAIGNGAVNQNYILDPTHDLMLEDEELIPGDERFSPERFVRNILPMKYQKSYPMNNTSTYGTPTFKMIDQEYYTEFYVKQAPVMMYNKVENGKIKTGYNITVTIDPSDIVASTETGGGIVNKDGTLNEIMLCFATPVKLPVENRIVNGRPLMYNDYVDVIPFYRFTFADIFAKDVKKPINIVFTFEA